MKLAAAPAVGVMALCTLPAFAQEAMYTAAATMPSKGTAILRQQVHMFRYGTRPSTAEERTDVLESMTTLSYGLARGWALSLDVPIEYTEIEGVDTADEGPGLDKLHAYVKYRFAKNDSGGIDTFRAALILGAMFPGGDSGYSGDSIDPHIGVVFTEVAGRHGFNQELSYTITTSGGGSASDNLGGDGPADALALNLAYVYRFHPADYSSESTGAWYLTAEVNSLYETNGDLEARFSPGIMYEGRVWGFEAMAQLPLWNDLEERPELDWAVGVGLRYFF